MPSAVYRWCLKAGHIEWLTVGENLRLGAYLRRDREMKADAEQWLDFFPALKGRVNQRPGRSVAVSSRCSPWPGQ